MAKKFLCRNGYSCQFPAVCGALCALLVLSEDAISLHVESRKFLIVQEFMRVLPRPSEELAMAGESAEPIERWTANVVTMCCDCKVSSTGPKGIEPPGAAVRVR